MSHEKTVMKETALSLMRAASLSISEAVSDMQAAQNALVAADASRGDMPRALAVATTNAETALLWLRQAINE